MNERTTGELIETLGADIDRCHADLIEVIDKGDIDSDGNVSAGYEYHARQLIRSILAYIEGAEWWSCLHETIRVRDRLTHPRMPGDLDVSGEEIVRALKAKSGFDEVLLEGRTEA